MRCSSCGFENPEGMNFCGKCGTSLGATPPDAAPPEDDSARLAERRRLTVMFCDLADSTSLSYRLDPEELRDVVRAYQGVCASSVEHFEGHIAQYLGDGVLVYFGYPKAHEDDARRAVYTALSILDGMAELNRRREHDLDVRLAVRIGIHTGLVVVGEMGGGVRREQLALGETPNLAARLQGLAERDTVVISAASYHLVGEGFDTEPLGLQTLKGVREPVEVFRVLGESTARDADFAAGDLTPFMGREHELRRLRESWRHTEQHRGRVLLVSGEAGLGKSRLVRILEGEVTQQGGQKIELRCSVYHRTSAFYSIIDWLHRLLRFKEDTSPESRLRRLEERLAEVGLPRDDTVPLLATLLSLPVPPERYAPLELSPQRQRQKKLEALWAWTAAEADKNPVLLLVEDLHWVDPSTLEFLELVVQRVAEAPMLAVMTHRPEFESPWSEEQVESLVLRRLDRQDVREMVEQLGGDAHLPGELVEKIIEQTDGVPLYVEELTRMVLESGLLKQQGKHYVLSGSLRSLDDIPTTLYDSLMARLDRLAGSRELAQLGSTLGREFSYELIRLMAECGEDQLRYELSQLVDAGLLQQKGQIPDCRFVFKHALIQEVAYQSLLKSNRRQYHRKISEILEERFPEIGETQPELLAHHCGEAGLESQAIVYLQKAGKRALGRSANLEAVDHLNRGLEILSSMAPSPDHAGRELTFQMMLAPAQMNLKGWAAPEVEQAYRRALGLCEELDDPALLFRVLRGNWGLYYVRGLLGQARELGLKVLDLAERLDDSGCRLEAHRALGATYLNLGELLASREHLEEAMGLYDPELHGSHAELYGQDPGVTGHAFAGITLWLLGYPQRALEVSKRAVELAELRGHPFSVAFAYSLLAKLHFFRREPEAAHRQARAALRIAQEQAFAVQTAYGFVFNGWSRAIRGHDEAGIRDMCEGLDIYRATGGEMGLTLYMAPLAEIYGHCGRVDEGLGILDEIFAIAEKTGERIIEPELHRLEGELILRRARKTKLDENLLDHQAEACFRKALEAARLRQAKSLELRTAVSLSHVWEKHGRVEEAWQLLTDSYEWFTEGFDTQDLVTARRRIDELSGKTRAAVPSGIAHTG